MYTFREGMLYPGGRVAVIGVRGLTFTDSKESSHFEKAMRLSGHWNNFVKAIYPRQAYDSIMGSAWNEPAPNPVWKHNGMYGMSLRYCTIDATYRKDAIDRGRHTNEEIDRFFEAWKDKLDVQLPLPDEKILEMWRELRPSPERRLKQRQHQKQHRRTKAFERRFLSSRNPEAVFRRLKAALPTRSPLDEEVLRQIATVMAQSQDQLFQAEQIRDAFGGDVIPDDQLPHYQKFLDLSIKFQKQALDLMKGHGLDYGTRRRQREAQTASQIFDDYVAHSEALFDERAIEIICPKCDMSLGYLLRHFPTVRYLTNATCPRCEKLVQIEMEALPDEVLESE
jgi:hypothetical protein